MRELVKYFNKGELLCQVDPLVQLEQLVPQIKKLNPRRLLPQLVDERAWAWLGTAEVIGITEYYYGKLSTDLQRTQDLRAGRESSRVRLNMVLSICNESETI